jgi:hypothetical protein
MVYLETAIYFVLVSSFVDGGVDTIASQCAKAEIVFEIG